MHRLIFFIARSLAYLGGAVLLFVVILTCISVIGRILNGMGYAPFVMENLASLASLLQLAKPVNGDYELVQAGMSLTIFCFLPWCQLHRSHAEVKILTATMPRTANNVLSLLWDILLTCAMCVIAWRILIATFEKMRYGETTFLLQMPSWWSYAACTSVAMLAWPVGLYSVWMHFKNLTTKNEIAT
jgi:TRAP-type C4-dicarboxylate transport system permease small subunit